MKNCQQRFRKRTVLILSNGHGEDAIGAGIAAQLQNRLDELGLENVHLSALPLIGLGQSYQCEGIRLVGPRMVLPSGGMSLINKKLLKADIKAGAAKYLLSMLVYLLRIRKQLDLIIGVGDGVICGINAFLMHKPMIFACVSFDRAIPNNMRQLTRGCHAVFVRSGEALENCRLIGIENAIYQGNPMMDLVKVAGIKFGGDPDLIKIGILPGSREEAYENLRLILRVSSALCATRRDRLAFLVAVAPSLSREKLGQIVEAAGRGIKVIMTDQFGDVINQSKLLIGLSGTGNLQAVGMGKPVVVFPSTGGIITSQYIQRLKKDLQGALLEVPSDPRQAATEISALLDKDELLKHVSEIGPRVVGPPGAIPAIVEEAVRFLVSDNKI